VPPEPVDAPAAFVMVNARALVPPPAARPGRVRDRDGEGRCPAACGRGAAGVGQRDREGAGPACRGGGARDVGDGEGERRAAAARGRRPGDVRDGDGEAAGAVPGRGGAGRVDQGEREGGRAAGRGGEAGVVGDVRVRLATAALGHHWRRMLPVPLTGTPPRPASRSGARAPGRPHPGRRDSLKERRDRQRVVARRSVRDRHRVRSDGRADLVFRAVAVRPGREREPGPCRDRARRLDHPAIQQVADRRRRHRRGRVRCGAGRGVGRVAAGRRPPDR
jgi:hypothetical protein